MVQSNLERLRQIHAATGMLTRYNTETVFRGFDSWTHDRTAARWRILEAYDRGLFLHVHCTSQK